LSRFKAWLFLSSVLAFFELLLACVIALIMETIYDISPDIDISVPLNLVLLYLFGLILNMILIGYFAFRRKK